ncbi:MAG: hypothetical protein GDA56_33380 [Hormoscilla sp. GM7CHS1pb]|nr:hypothetical protein [Hormoscilla sp. GM7CHS1pb]
MANLQNGTTKEIFDRTYTITDAAGELIDTGIVQVQISLDSPEIVTKGAGPENETVEIDEIINSKTERKTVERTVSQAIARGWIDSEFQERFFDDPAATLREAGLLLEESVQVEVVGSSQPVLRFAGSGGEITIEILLPAKPAALTDEQLIIEIGNDGPGGCSCC